MEFTEAFCHAQALNGWSDVRIAYQFGVSVSAVRKWRTHQGAPRGPLWQRLRNEFPHFADLIDGKTVAA